MRHGLTGHLTFGAGRSKGGGFARMGCDARQNGRYPSLGSSRNRVTSNGRRLSRELTRGCDGNPKTSVATAHNPAKSPHLQIPQRLARSMQNHLTVAHIEPCERNLVDAKDPDHETPASFSGGIRNGGRIGVEPRLGKSRHSLPWANPTAPRLVQPFRTA